MAPLAIRVIAPLSSLENAFVRLGFVQIANRRSVPNRAVICTLPLQQAALREAEDVHASDDEVIQRSDIDQRKRLLQ